MAPAIYCATSLFTGYGWKRHFTQSSGLGEKVDEGPIHQDRVQEALGPSACSWGGEASAGNTCGPQQGAAQGLTFGGADLESERKRQPGQSPGKHQLVRDSSWQEASKERRQRSSQRGRREAGRYQTSSQSPSGTLYFSSLVTHSVCLTLPTLTPSQFLLLPAKFPFILQVSA